MIAPTSPDSPQPAATSASANPNAPRAAEPTAAPAAETRACAVAAELAGVRFVDDAARERAMRAWHEAGWLVVAVRATAPRTLADAVDDAIEDALAARGAVPAGLGASGGDREARLRDQLFRARRVSAPGIGIAIASLRAPLDGGALDPRDGEALRFFADVARARPVAVALDARDEELPAYAHPVPLALLLAPPAPRPVATLAPVRVLAPVPDPTPDRAPAPAPAPEPELERAAAPAPPASAAETVVADADGEPRRVRGPRLAFRSATTAPAPTPTPTPPAEDGLRWRTWQLALDGARGPQPLASFERLFAEHYLPLLHAIANGLDDPRARGAAEEFRRTFARAYADAFPTFALTGKRPRMVFDAPDLAGRSARLHGARASHVVLVSSLRFDMGATFRDALLEELGPRATPTEEHVLYSALPSTTHRQLEGMARGIDAYRGVPARMSTAATDADVVLDDDADGGIDERTVRRHGRAAEVLRRVRAGAREIYELDLVDARLRARAGHVDASALAEASRDAARALARHARTLPGRTLVFAFGDRGFCLDGAGVARHGGASPEEVLVPAYGVLLGEVH